MIESVTLPTGFAPAERASPADLRRQAQQLQNTPLLQHLIDCYPGAFLLLNQERQIVCANLACQEVLGLEGVHCAIGARPGEALNCVHAHETQGGCGTTNHCGVCGAVHAILASQKGGKVISECRMTRHVDGRTESLDLEVCATPFEFDGQCFTAFGIADISHLKRRRALERIFFHDVANTATCVDGYSQLVRKVVPKEEQDLADHLCSASDRLCSEIAAQRGLLEAESGELEVHPEEIETLAFLKTIQHTYERQPITENRRIIVDPTSERITFKSDSTLLGRVFGNMVKNALEASHDGEDVTIGCYAGKQDITLWVHNSSTIPQAAQLQIFQRSFSTKGAGRGLGTYSMKLLTERYLKGEVSFTSSEDKGTTFLGRYPLDLARGDPSP